MSEKIIALVGNPNTGKTTLFNTISNAEEHVGNWHGVTVDYKERKIKLKNGKRIILTDLPGTYSLSAYSYEEAVSRDYIINHPNIGIINICDANNLARNLLLTLELIEMGFNPVLCINMANELEKTGRRVDVKKLEKALGIKVFLINAQKKKEVSLVVDYVTNCKTKKQNNNLPYIEKLMKKYRVLLNLELSVYQKIKLLEIDEYWWALLSLPSNEKKGIKKRLIENGSLDEVINLRYKYIDDIVSTCVLNSGHKKIYGYSKIDKIVLNKWFALPIFLILVSLIFVLTFGQIGTSLSYFLSCAFDKLIFIPFMNLIKSSTQNIFIINFINEALFGSILSLVSFLPQIILMFLGLYILEDSGYMSRLAFSLEDYFKKVGLSGKSVFTLLMGFGCGTTASLTCRNMEDKNGKIKTAILTPFVSCSAKLPLYTVVCNAFFPKTKFIVVVCLYLLGIVVALTVSYILSKTILPSREQSFIMELPPYRFPSLKKILKNILTNIKQFILRVGTILLSFSCIVWLLENCNFKFEYHTGESILEAISKFLAPIFVPLGFGNYGAVACLLCGFIAKEIIVSTISFINKVPGTNNIKDVSNSLLLSSSVFCLTKSSSLAFLVFVLLYIPCISTISVFIKEIGRKWTIIACLIELSVSYVLSFITYRISYYFVCYGILSGIISLCVFLIIVILVCLFVHMIKSRNKCRFCKNYDNCSY